MFRFRRVSFRGFLWLLAIGLVLCSPRSLCAAAPTANEVDRWIADLSNDNYLVRKAAAEQLALGGPVVRDALISVSDGPDPEVRTTARRLLSVIDDTEFNRRLAEFAADTDGRRGATLPGWKEFGDLVGRDAAARALFVDMQRDEGALLARSFGPTTDTREVNWEDHVARLMRARIFNQQGGEFALPVGSCATLLFLSSLDDANVSDRGAQGLLGLSQAIAPSKPSSAVRRLVTAWIVHCPNRSEMVLEQRLHLMIQQQLEGALPLALEIIERKPNYLTIGPSLQVTALMAVGKFGSEQHIDTIEPLLDDRTELNLGQQSMGLPGAAASIQVRDVALAALLHLTEQEPLTYGFMHAQANPLMVYDVRTLTLENDERRAVALERWRAWRVKHKPSAARPASS